MWNRGKSPAQDAGEWEEWFQSLNLLQQRILIVAITIVALMILFPPWNAPRRFISEKVYTTIEYKPLFSPPSPVKKPWIAYPSTNPLDYIQRPPKPPTLVRATLAWGILCTQLSALVVCTVAALLLARRRKRS